MSIGNEYGCMRRELITFMETKLREKGISLIQSPSSENVYEVHELSGDSIVSSTAMDIVTVVNSILLQLGTTVIPTKFHWCAERWRVDLDQSNHGLQIQLVQESSVDFDPQSKTIRTNRYGSVGQEILAELQRKLNKARLYLAPPFSSQVAFCIRYLENDSPVLASERAIEILNRILKEEKPTASFYLPVLQAFTPEGSDHVPRRLGLSLQDYPAQQLRVQDTPPVPNSHFSRIGPAVLAASVLWLIYVASRRRVSSSLS